MAQVSLVQIPIEKLKPSKFNVRKSVGDIAELTASIKAVGVLEPILIRPAGNLFEVVVGSRRLAASRKAGLKGISAIIKQMTDDQALLESLSENIQRGDITEEEVVAAFNALKSFNPKRWTQEAFAEKLGKSQEWVSSLLTAYESFIKLSKAGLFKGMSSHPTQEERKQGVAPTTILTELERAMRSDTVHRSYSPVQIEKKRVELGKAVKDLPFEDATRVIDRFKMYPEKPVERTREEALAATAGVALKTYLSPTMARQIEEKTGRPVGEALTQVLEKGLQSMSTAVQEERPPMKHWADELTQDPMPVQVANWWKWNLDRVGEKFDFFTTHYSQKDLDTFVETLRAAGVGTLIDVRDSPFSQFRPEFNKDGLAKALQGKGIKYEGHPELGVPKEQREKLAKSGNWSALFEWYDKNVVPRLEGVLNSRKSKSQGLTAFLCVEKDPTKCHRHRIARALEAKGLKSIDL
jgi:ParB/RepB/Spo0J family partition protein